MYEIKEYYSGNLWQTWIIKSDLKYSELYDIFEKLRKPGYRYLVTRMSIMPLEECLNDIG